MSVRLVFFVLSGAVFLAACSGPRPRTDAPANLPEAFPYHTLAQIRANLGPPADTLVAFHARASLAIRSPEQSGQFSAELRGRRDDSLYASISPGLGIEAARALVTPDSFFLYDRLKNRLAYGALADAGGVLPAPLASDDLFGNLLGLLVPAPGVDWRVSADSAHYVLDDPDGRRRYVIDPARWRVVRYEERDAAGQPVEVRQFSEFDRYGGLYLPRRVTFEQPREGSRAMIYYRSLSVNPGQMSLAMRVSASAERILVQ